MPRSTFSEKVNLISLETSIFVESSAGLVLLKVGATISLVVKLRLFLSDIPANELLEEASLLEEERVEAIKEKPKLPSIQERTKAKIVDTIYSDWDENVVEEYLEFSNV